MKHPNGIVKTSQKSDIEPCLEDMLADPLIQLVMQRDGVSKAHIKEVMDQTRVRLMAVKEPVQPQASSLEYYVYP